jgi:hypothetical protein
VAALAISLMVYIFISDVKALVYSGIKTFFHSILSIFFRSVDVVGRYVFTLLHCNDRIETNSSMDCYLFLSRENIPQYGPVIFTSTSLILFVLISSFLLLTRFNVLVTRISC